tara:strand:+ start:283 stop:453 length:171 start_codon:yes stop_codon:yes gene_type:complete
MSIDQLMSVIFLIAVLILVIPAFLETNSKLKIFLKNLSIWSIIVLSLMVVSYLIYK